MQFLDFFLDETCDFNITVVENEMIAVAYPTFFEHTRHWHWEFHFVYVANIVSMLSFLE